MSTRAQYLLAALVAGVILIAGLGYATAKTTTYESSGSLVLAPSPSVSPDQRANLLGAFTASGSSGTYVELISSKDTLTRARVSGVSVSVRAIPDARAIQVFADGPQELVTPALGAVMRAAIARESEIGDVWQLHVLQSPSDAAPSGAGKSTLAAATVVLALLAALFVLVVLRRYLPGGTGEAQDPGANELVAGAPGAGAGPLLGAGAGGAPAQAEGAVSFHLESFRFVAASPATVLLQVVGYWRSDVPRQLSDPVLLIHDGRLMHPLAPVAAPEQRAPVAGPETPLWRGSYASPIDIFNRHKRIALRAGPGVVVGLPQPREQQILGKSEDEAAGNGNGRADESFDFHPPHDETEADTTHAPSGEQAGEHVAGTDGADTE